MRRMPPAAPMLRMLPVLPIDKMLPLLPIESRLPALPIESTLPALAMLSRLVKLPALRQSCLHRWAGRCPRCFRRCHRVSAPLHVRRSMFAAPPLHPGVSLDIRVYPPLVDDYK